MSKKLGIVSVMTDFRKGYQPRLELTVTYYEERDTTMYGFEHPRFADLPPDFQEAFRNWMNATTTVEGRAEEIKHLVVGLEADDGRHERTETH